MLATALFIIRPGTELKLSILDRIDELSHLDEPVVWSLELADRSGWSRAEVVSGIKAAFVAHVAHSYSNTGLPGSTIPNESAVGQFDQYWTLEVFWDIDDSVENVVRDLPASLVTDPFLRAFRRA